MTARPSYLDALRRLDLLSVLAPFDPHVAGTPPLGLDLPGSDIDVLCHVMDSDAFLRTVWTHAAHREGFAVRQWASDTRPIVASFKAHDWTIEIFGDPRPVALQPGWRHFTVERRLLASADETFRTAIMDRRRHGLKTEPAFAAVLQLAGDPYLALLDLETKSDTDLVRMLDARGFAVTVASRKRPGGE